MQIIVCGCCVSLGISLCILSQCDVLVMIFSVVCLSKHSKIRNVFNMDFPDSNHLAKTLTLVSGPDTVNLTYHNFFASKEKVTQVISPWQWVCPSSSCSQFSLSLIVQTQLQAITCYTLSLYFLQIRRLLSPLKSLLDFMTPMTGFPQL